MNEPNVFNIPAYQRKRTLKKSRTRKTTIKSDDAFTNIPVKEVIPSRENFIEQSKLSSRKIREVREMKICGICDGYFEKIQVAIIKVTSPIKSSDILIFEKEGGLFQQPIASMQIDRKDVSLARSGSDIGTKVVMEPKVGAHVYKYI